MMYADTTRRGKPWSKNPFVLRFGGRYLMYSSILPVPGSEAREIEITESHDLIHWKNVGVDPRSGALRKERHQRPVCADQGRQGPSVLSDLRQRHERRHLPRGLGRWHHQLQTQPEQSHLPSGWSVELRSGD